MKGTLYLAPAPLDFGCEPPLPPLTDVLPLATLQRMAQLRYWICENAKTTRALLKRVDALVPLAAPIQELDIAVLPREAHKKGDHLPGSGQPEMALQLLRPALEGHDMALGSEAGIPAVADPGSSIVRAAHQAGIHVVPLVGPNSLLLALAASGLNGQNFAFTGYLPQEAAERAKRLRELEHLAWQHGQTQLWIETPYRNQAVLAHALQVLKPETRLCVAYGLTLPAMQIVCDSVARLRKQPPALPPKMPAVFALGL